MLGSAPGTDLLNHWVEDVNDGMSLEDIANHIAESDAFTTTYPTFLTNAEFAESFLANLMGSEEVPAALVTAAEGIVTGLLNDGMTRGALALAVFTAMYQIHDQGEAHAAYADLGMVANGLFNKIEVAEYYTVDLRQESSNSRVLRDVNSETGLDEVRDSIGDHLDPPDPIFLTKSRDNIEGTVANDLIIAEPDSNGEDTLDPFDTIDGGGGTDTLEVYAGLDGITIDKNHADVMSVEHVYLSSRAGISADLTGWEGVESVELGRFGSGSDVSLTVAGADVSTSRTFGGSVTITGAGGDLDLTAGSGSAVTVGSGAHTTSVSVKGGMSVTVHNGRGGASENVTSVSLDGVARNLGTDMARGTAMMPMANPAYDGDADDDSDGTPNSEDTDYTVLPYLDTQDPAQPTADATMAAMVAVEGAKDDASVFIHSEAIDSFSISNTDAIVVLENTSDEPGDLTITVDKFGKHMRGAFAGKICITDDFSVEDGVASFGTGSPENIMIDVVGDSEFQLTAGSLKALSISGAGGLILDLDNADGSAASTSVESITASGSGKVTMNVAGMGKLETIDASASSGTNTFTAVGDSVESVSGGSGTDIVHVMMHSGDGLAADLGDGNDVFISGAGNSKSRVDGGAGMDTLRLTSAEGQTHTPTGGRPTSNYSNFEVLDVGGSTTATYNAALIGVNSVIVSESTALTAGADTEDTADDVYATVTLMGMGDGMGIGVRGKDDGTTASIVHMMPDRDPGSARYSGELDVHLTANGGAEDSKATPTGQVMLTLNADAEIEVLNVNSSANPGGSSPTVSARNKPSAGNYANTLTLDTGATVEAINVSGNAKLTIAETGTNLEFALLELVDAEDNTGGVTITLDSAHDEDMDMLGGSGGDSFTGGAGDDTMHGNGGNDMLNGAAGADTIRGGAGMDMLTGGAGGTVGTGVNEVTDRNIFQYTEASESSLSFTATGGMQGFDTITDWGTATNNVISLGRTLFNSLQGTLKSSAEGSGGANFAVNDSTGNAAPDTMQALIGDGDGFFETRSAVEGGFGGTTNKHSIAVVEEALEAVPDDTTTPDVDESRPEVSRTWIFIDVDGDGDYTAGTDMAIALNGTSLSIDTGDFSA